MGVYSILFANYFRDATVCSFEPIPESCEALRAHITMNGLQGRVYPYEVALWCSPRSMTLGLPANSADTGRYSVHERGALVDVEATSLHLWCLDHSILPDFIKLDVEGAEAYVLQNEDEVLQSCRWLVIEDRHYRAEVKPVWDKLQSLGFVEVPDLTRKVFSSDRVFENTRVVPATLGTPFQPRGWLADQESRRTSPAPAS